MSENPDLDKIMSIMARRSKQDTGRYFIDLQSSEKAILSTAANIYSAYITSGKVTSGQEEEFISKSVNAAIKMALRIEKLIADAEEEHSA
ncbi:MAG: hypothetical protein GWO07_08635 [Candidatus Dadabacteria bacterium]|nr:hypothetical protein [Candidatus Dadabacteria bacterium]NIS08813.1 hypothetical protein [Candidatus Dadabacteria bacterium]NIY22163.1 hypothetical protein [Candidatus Dadabacteria bacterium]